MATLSTTTHWSIELFSYSNPWPSEDDFSSFGENPIVVFSSDDSNDLVTQVTKSLSVAKALVKDIAVRKSGIVSVSIGRSKRSPSSEASISIVGPVPPEIQLGAWVVISQIYGYGGGYNRTVKFVGQIDVINYSYSTDNNGLIVISTNVTVAEWSKPLSTNLMLDPVSQTGFNVQAAPGIPAALNALGKEGAEKSISDELINSIDPFEFAELVLAYAGVRVGEPSSKVNNDTMNTPPFIPNSLIERLGLDNGLNLPSIPGDSSAKNLFSAKFVKTVSGNVPSSFIGLSADNISNLGSSSGKWSGWFINQFTMNSYINAMKEHGEENKPFRPGNSGNIMALTSLDFNIWDILNNGADSEIFEVYTDMWYFEKDGLIGPLAEGEVSVKDISAQPVVIIRDKPYLNRSFKYEDPNPSAKSPDGLFDHWSLFDNIPRVHIDDSSIVRFSPNIHTKNSPNYIRTFGNSHGYGKWLGAAFITGGFSKEDLRKESNRFGGSGITINTQFEGNPSASGSALPTADPGLGAEWVGVLRSLMRFWYGYDYRYGKGSLTIKETGTPISVGFNVTFKVGGWTLVGQVDGYKTNVSMDDDGLLTTSTTISLSHIMYQPKESTQPLSPASQLPLPSFPFNPASNLPPLLPSPPATLPAFVPATPNYLKFVRPDKWGDLMHTESD